MNNIDLLKKKILYRSEYRSTKEMDLLLSNFVKKYITDFGIVELKQLDDLLNFDDDSLFKWYLNKKTHEKEVQNRIIKEKEEARKNEELQILKESS